MKRSEVTFDPNRIMVWYRGDKPHINIYAPFNETALFTKRLAYIGIRLEDIVDHGSFYSLKRMNEMIWHGYARPVDICRAMLGQESI